MKIYLTHCSAKKSNSLRISKEKVTPDKLYTATPTRRFMRRCVTNGVKWAIFSDLYGVWFPNVKHEWYEKSPDSVTEIEFRKLLRDFEENLQSYKTVYFYRNPGRFHQLYRKLLRETKLKNKIILISHLEEIV